MQSNIIIEEFRFKDIKYINKIYEESFSQNNRFPKFLLYFNTFRKKAKLLVIRVDNEICGFIYLIFYKDMVFILYLAITASERNKGYGGMLLQWCLTNYKNKDFYLNIDEINANFDDYKIRKKRCEFYLKNKFYLTNYLSVNDNFKGNILSLKKDLNVERYKKIDKKISVWFLTSKDKIEKINF